VLISWLSFTDPVPAPARYSPVLNEMSDTMDISPAVFDID